MLASELLQRRIFTRSTYCVHTTLSRVYSEKFQWRIQDFIAQEGGDIPKLSFCTQTPGTKPLEDKTEPGPKQTKKLASRNTDEIMAHNKEALSQMEKKIKENTDLIEKEVKRNQEQGQRSKDNIIKEEVFQYVRMLNKYLPIRGMEELQSILRRELGQFKFSDLNSVPNNIVILSLAGLTPFLIPSANLILFGGYRPGMELIQITYSSILLSSLSTLQLSPHIGDMFSQKLSKAQKADINPLVAPIGLAWLSVMFIPSGVGLVLNSVGLVILLLEDIKRNRPRPTWYGSLRMATTSTAVVTLLVMAIGKLAM